jgi:hypothetical protein
MNLKEILMKINHLNFHIAKEFDLLNYYFYNKKIILLHIFYNKSRSQILKTKIKIIFIHKIKKNLYL